MKIAHETFRIHAVENGWVVTLLWDGDEIPARGEYVFRSVEELVEWISCCFYHDAKEIRDAQRADKCK